MPKRRVPSPALYLFLLLLLPLLPGSTPLNLSLPVAPTSRQTVVTRCDDWVTIYAAYWGRFPQCHQGHSSTQCCELYDLMDKSIRIFESNLNCVVTNLEIFADKYNAYCRGSQGITEDGTTAGGPGQPVPDPNIQGGHGDEDGILLLPDGTTQINDNSGTTGGPTTSGGGGASTPIDDGGASTSTGGSASTTSSGTEGGHGCGSTGCQTHCHQCCYTCCGYTSARILLTGEKESALVSLPRSTKTHGGCINCSGGCDCKIFICASQCTACSKPPPTPSPKPPPVHCHQCCYTCCGYRSGKALLTGGSEPVSAISVQQSGKSGCTSSGCSGGCDCSSFYCDSHCKTCGGGPDCSGCTSGCSTCPSGCSSSCSGSGDSGTSGGTCPSCTGTSGDDPVANTDPNNNNNEGSGGGEQPVVFDGSPCFGGASLLELRDGRMKRMDLVEVGDVVHVGHGVYSEVFMFTHRSRMHAGEFVDLHTKGGKLSVTKGHFVHSSRGVRAVEALQVGDSVMMGDGSLVRIEGISIEIRKGLYNPQTLHGDVVVDGFLTTTYTVAMKPGAAQSLLAPLRGLYRVCGRWCGEQVGAILFRAAS